MQGIEIRSTKSEIRNKSKSRIANDRNNWHWSDPRLEFLISGRRACFGFGLLMRTRTEAKPPLPAWQGRGRMKKGRLGSSAG
jgi:hypothetical protein